MNKKKEILIVIPQLKKGGTEIQVLNIIQRSSDKINYIILCLSDKKSSDDYILSKLKFFPNLYFGSISKNILEFLQIIYQIKKNHKVSLIHSYNYEDIKWDLIIKVFYPNTILITERRNIQHWRVNKRISLLERIRNHYTSLFIANCNATKRFSMVYEQLPEHKFKVIYNGIDKWNGYKSNLDGTLRILSLGNIKEVKNQGILIEVLKRLKRYNLQIKVVGRTDTLYFDEIHKNKEINNIQNIFFEGEKNTDEIEEYLKWSNLTINTSTAEGFPNSILESFKYGVPVIASNIGGNNELVDDGVNGFLFNPNSIEDLVDKISIYYELDEKSRGRMSAECLKTAEGLSYEKTISCYISIYEE